jgi:hypothetical protein
LAKLVFADPASIFALVIAAMAFAGALLVLVAGDRSLGSWILVAFGFGAAAFIVYFLVRIVVRTERALATGLRTDAIVVTSEYIPPGRSGLTVAALEHGLTRGKRRVIHPRGEFVEDFAFDRAGAAKLRTGSRMALLVDPLNRQVLLDLGVIAA